MAQTQKCIFCQGKDVYKTVSHGYTQFTCNTCDAVYDEEDISFFAGRKSKNKQKFTGKHRGAIPKFGF